jgi:hypothetical protein
MIQSIYFTIAEDQRDDDDRSPLGTIVIVLQGGVSFLCWLLPAATSQPFDTFEVGIGHNQLHCEARAS